MRSIAAWVGVASVVLVGCSSASDTSATSAASTPPPSASSTAANAEALAWAGDVCADMARVKASVGALGRNLTYDLSGDRSALEQIQRQLTIQVLALGDAASALQASLTRVPVDFVAANDVVDALTKSGADTREAAGAVGSHLKAAADAGNLVSAAAELGQALIAAKAAYEAGEALLDAIGDATSTTNTELRAAFDASPHCAAL